MRTQRLNGGAESGTEVKNESGEVKKTSSRKRAFNETVTTTVNRELMAKVRVIALKENLSINTLFDIGMRLAIKNYENKFGEIIVPPSPLQTMSIEEMFDL